MKRIHASIKPLAGPAGVHIVVVGAGRVGQTLARLLSNRGYVIDAVVCRSRSSAQRAKRFTRAQQSTTVISKKLFTSAHIVFVTPPDRFIAATAHALAGLDVSWKTKTVFHASGALTSEELASLRRRGACVASLHPLQTFPTPAEGIKRAKGVFYTFEGAPRAERSARRLVHDLGGHFVKIRGRDKSLYHCAGTFACGALLAPLSMAYALYQEIGFDEETSRKMLKPMVDATLEVAQTRDLRRSITGPISRGDAETIAGHIRALSQTAPQFIGLYKSLSLRLLELKASRLARKKLTAIRRLLT